MTEKTLKVPQPTAPHPDTLKDPELTIMDTGRGRLVCYCPRNRAGAVLHIEAGLWAIYSPMSVDEFVNTIGERGIALPQGADLERWLTAVGASRGNAH